MSEGRGGIVGFVLGALGLCGIGALASLPKVAAHSIDGMAHLGGATFRNADDFARLGSTELERSFGSARSLPRQIDLETLQRLEQLRSLGGSSLDSQTTAAMDELASVDVSGSLSRALRTANKLADDLGVGPKDLAQELAEECLQGGCSDDRASNPDPSELQAELDLILSDLPKPKARFELNQELHSMDEKTDPLY